MSLHWRLAAGGAIAALVVSLVASVVVGYVFGDAYAGAFLYGAAVGIVCFTSIAVAVALIGGRLAGERLPLVMGVYAGRVVFAVVGIGTPIALGSWPVLAMLCGIAGVYVIENALILFGARRIRGSVGAPWRESEGAS